MKLLSLLASYVMGTPRLEAVSYGFKLTSLDKARIIIKEHNYSMIPGEFFEAKLELNEKDKGELAYFQIEAE
jgi:hypothetical protein